MRNNRPAHTPSSPDEAQSLVERAARQGATLDLASARALSSLGALAARRKLDGACRMIRALRAEDLNLSFRGAWQRIDMCGGDVEEAVRRILAGRRARVRDDIAETVGYAANRGVTLAPGSIGRLFRERGRSGAQSYIDKLALIMDAASAIGMDCTQALATRRLALAEGDALHVVAGFAAERRRRADRQNAPCRVLVLPRAPDKRTNALAGCGCQRCSSLLAVDMQRYIGKLIAAPFCRDLDREEARAEAHLELVESIESWPGGSFTGWFAASFVHRVLAIYNSRSTEERAMLSLDADYVLSDDDGGRIVSLGERIPDRSVDVLVIVLLRERIAEAELQLRRVRADRGEEYANRPLAEEESAKAPLRLVRGEDDAMASRRAGAQSGFDSRAA